MTKKERWASRLGLVLAMAGNAVGLGNFLRFPAQTIANGGGAFLIPYFVALVVLGMPLIWVEWTMGRYGGQQGHHSTPGIFQSMGRHRMWKYLGVFGLWCNLIIAAFYLYIESWTMAYAGNSLIGGFKNTTGREFYDWLTGEVKFEIFAISPIGMLFFFSALAINVYILSRGLAKGIEIVSKIGMPILIVFAACLAIRGMLITPPVEGEPATYFTDPQAVASPWEGLNFMWKPKFDSLYDPAVWLAAAGQIFFTLSIGMGNIHCYASYLRESDDITLTGATAAWTNEFCEVILGGTILIPIAVAYLGLQEVKNQVSGGSGFGLGFMVFPGLFQKWGALASAAGFMWFGLLFFAAITSSLAMGQPIIAFLQSEFNFSREKGALTFGLMLLPLALGVAMVSQKSFFDEFDYWGGTFSLVVFAFIEAVLFAWVFGMDKGWAEMQNGAEMQVPFVFYYIIKYITPTFLGLILLAYIFKGEFVETPTPPGSDAQPVKTWAWSKDGMIGKLLQLDVLESQAAANKKLEDANKALEASDASPEAKEELTKKVEDAHKEIKFYSDLHFWRIIDRLMIAGSFLGFVFLVRIAWQRRYAEGRA
ncbi:MAG: sodium-dependent transporter [Planctomycetaceae bacterium]